MTTPLYVSFWVGIAIAIVGFVGRMVARTRYLHNVSKYKPESDEREYLADRQRKQLRVYLAVMIVGIILCVTALEIGN